MILVNANYFQGVFASFSSLVKESAEFPCNKETLHTCRLNTFCVVLNFFFRVSKLIGLKKAIYRVRVPIFKYKLVCLFLTIYLKKSH